MVKYCMYCGEAINEGDTKCSKCGAEVEEIEVINQNAVDNKENEDNTIEINPTNTSDNNQFNENNSNETIEKTGTNGLAIGSLVCSLCGLLVAGLILGIVAISLGVSARNQLKVFKNQKGKGLATAGIVIGIIDVVVIAISLVVKITALK